MDTPMKLMNRLVTYINDDRAIIAHIKREFSVNYSLADVQRARRLMPRHRIDRSTPASSSEMTDWRIQARLSDARMVAALGRASR